MKKRILLTFLFVFVGCADIYSPFGVKGKDAKKEIEDLDTNLAVLTIVPLLSFSISPSTFSCPLDSGASLGSTNASTPANYTLPTGNNFVDLDARAGGTLHFRSNPSTQLTSYNIQGITTDTTSSSVSSCTATISASACVDPIVAGNSIFSSFGPSSVEVGSCLAIRCTSPSYIRILPYRASFLGSSGNSSSSLSSLLSIALGPELFNSISGIKEDTYYTRESLEKCKKGIINISVITSTISITSLSVFREVVFCNKPISLVPPMVDTTASYALQGDECKLEEVNAIGF